MPNIITIHPFRWHKPQDPDLIICTNKSYEEIKDKELTRKREYCNYAMILPHTLEEMKNLCVGKKNIPTGLNLSFGLSAEGLGATFENHAFPRNLEEGEGLAVNFKDWPDMIVYKGSKNHPVLYICHGFNSDEEEAFIAGLAQRTDFWKQFASAYFKSKR